jgi:hypothetical protein
MAQEAEDQVFKPHKRWNAGKEWKHGLNNLRLIIQPYVLYCLLSPWLENFHIPSLRKGWKLATSHVLDRTRGARRSR